MHRPTDDSSGKVLKRDAARVRDVAAKQERVSKFLTENGFDALLLEEAHNVSWMTAGANVARAGSCETIASVFMTPGARVVVTNNVDSPLLFERELFGLGFQLKERAWQLPRGGLIRDLCLGRNVASDTGAYGTTNVSQLLRDVRMPLSDLECDRLRQLGRVVVHAVESTARNVNAGQTEAEVAGEVAHRLIKRTVAPEQIRVAADGRNERFRHWSYGNDSIENYVTISCIARRWGLCAGVTRTVVLGEIPDNLKEAHRRLVLMHATGLFFSRHDVRFSELWPKVHRIYEKFGLPHEWRMAEQADLIEYETRSASLVRDEDYHISGPTALHWHPSAGPAICGDTVLIRPDATEMITPLGNWPRLTISVRGATVQSAGILQLGETNKAVSTGDTAQLVRAHSEELESPCLDSVWELDTYRAVLEQSEPR